MELLYTWEGELVPPTLQEKLNTPRENACYDRTNIYRKPSQIEMELGHCNKTYNPDWSQNGAVLDGAIEYVDWFYCKDAKVCVDITTRWVY